MPRSTAVRLLSLIGLAALALTACGNDDTSSDDSSSTAAPRGSGSTTELDSTSWSLTTWTDGQGAEQPAGGTNPVIGFGAGGKLSGNTGCNTFSGTWEGGNGELTIETGPLTAMACPPEVEAQEQAVLAALEATTAYRVEDDTLELLDADGDALLTLLAASDDLAGTSWTATGINNGRGGVESAANTSTVTAEFAEDGTLVGNSGCNTYSATWTTDDTDSDDTDSDDTDSDDTDSDDTGSDDTESDHAASGEGAGISIGEVTVTEMSCGPELDTLEQQYLAALDAATTYAVRGTTLELRDASGALQVGFSPAG